MFVAVSVKVTFEPTAGVALLTLLAIATSAVGRVTVAWVVGLVKPAAEDEATLVTKPFVMSVAVIVYDAVQVSDSPTSRKLSRSPTVVTAGHVTVVLSSATVTGPCSEAKPLLLTM